MSTSIKDAELADFGKITYNDFPFDIIRNVKFKGRFVYDDAGLTITHVEYTMFVKGFINGESANACEVNMFELHTKLSEAGQKLTIEGIGWDLDIDTSRSGSTPDMIWGAQPIEVDLRPLGGNLAWEFTWSVKFNISRCETRNVPLADRLMAFNYEVTYSADSQGLIERTTTGYIQIPQNRTGGIGDKDRDITRDLETAWDKVRFQIPECFRRMSTTRKLNAKRNRIDFNIVDKELHDFAYPNGIIEADADYDFQNVGRSFESWIATLSVDFEVAPGYPPSLAATKFFLMMAEKTAKLRATALAAKGTVIPIKLRMTSKPFGRRSRFQVTWNVVACLREILASSGMYDPVAGTSYTQWATSMNSVGVWNPRGRGGWRHTPDQDLIVDVCSGKSLPDMGGDQGTCVRPDSIDSESMLCPSGHPYMHWENEIHGEQSQNVVIHKLSQFFQGVVSADTLSSAFAVPFGLNIPSIGQAIDHITQYESASDNYVVMIGRAIRLGESPDVPRLVTVGGTPVEEVKRAVVEKAIANYFGCPAIGSRWAILYRVRGAIQTIKPPNSKQVLCFTDGEDDGISIGQ